MDAFKGSYSCGRQSFFLQVNKMKKVLYLCLSGLLTLVVLVLSVITIIKSNQLSEVKLKYENSLISSTREAINDMRTIEADLSKLMITTDNKVTVQLLSIVALKSSACAQELSKLPAIATGAQNTLKFANQLSSYSTTTIKNFSEGFNFPENFDKQITEFFTTCKQVNDELNILEADILNGNLSLMDIREENQIANGIFASIDENLIEYPSVIFDGPFSDGQERETPKTKREPVSKEKAQEFIKSLGFDCAFEKKIGGQNPLYQFKNENTIIQIAKNGGLLYLIVSDEKDTEPKLTKEQAQKSAEEFVQKLNLGNVKNIWQEFYGNFIVFNFAPEINETVIYPDIFKVKVSLKDGSILGFEGKSYIMNNQERNLPQIKFSKEQAKEKLKEGFLVETSRLALISINEKEQLTWEFFGKYNDLEFAVYISATDGQEKTSFRILSTETGQMVV